MQSRTISRGVRMLAAMFALVLVAAACGDDDSQDAGATTTVAEHDHDETVDVSDLDPTPSVAVEVTEDPMAGWNLRFDATGHELAPEDASTEYVEGEGHAHLYIDGEKQTRLYTEHSFLGELEPGSHEVAVELSANDHRALAVDGEVVMDTVTVEVPEPDGEEHGHGEPEPIDASSFEPTPTISVEVAEDPKAGWNLHAEVEGHEFAPESVSTEAVDGEGHAHIYVDGEKLTRLYGAWYFLGDLEPGEREIRVELSANDHSPLAIDGAIVDDTVTIEVPGDDDTADDDAAHAEDTDEADHEHEDGTDGDPVDATAADSTIELTVTAGSAGGDTGRQETALGDTVLVRVTSDAADEVHVHGYDHIAAVAPGETAEIQFVADIPGVFEIELEGSGLLLAELAVS